MNLTPIRRRTLWPSKSFEHHERSMMFGVTLAAYMLCVGAPYVWMIEHTSGRTHSLVTSDAIGWAMLAALVPFWLVFQRAWIRLLRTPKPKRTTAQIEESPAELSAWASSVLDKKRKTT